MSISVSSADLSETYRRSFRLEEQYLTDPRCTFLDVHGDRLSIFLSFWAQDGGVPGLKIVGDSNLLLRFGFFLYIGSVWEPRDSTLRLIRLGPEDWVTLTFYYVNVTECDHPNILKQCNFTSHLHSHKCRDASFLPRSMPPPHPPDRDVDPVASVAKPIATSTRSVQGWDEEYFVSTRSLLYPDLTFPGGLRITFMS